MVICPSCSTDNIPGSETCEECGQDLSGPDIRSDCAGFDRQLLADTLQVLPLDHLAALGVEASVADAVRSMKDLGIGCILVFDSHRLAGIFTERDLVKKIKPELEDLEQLKLRDVMTPDPAILHEEDTIAYALNRMSVGGFRHVPVLRANNSVGLISIRDVLHYIATQIS
ncbi:MAG: CBS domain-containing protein [Acidobacteria bacterium]|nr:CBS domain-containing protein [Acidobacteriota bacterium]